MEGLYLIVGLGNPGRSYARTRHNVGFLATERLGERWGGSWRTEARLESRVARVQWEARPVLLLQPQTYMNLSGRAVRAAVDYYRVELPRLLVIVDDADLPLGQLRMRPEGSSGGHHGLESIEQHLGTRAFARQRIGIGRQPDGRREITDYVLTPFSPEERQTLEKVLTRAVEQIECWMRDGIDRAMSRFNGPVQTTEQ